MDSANRENPNFMISDTDQKTHTQHHKARMGRRSVGTINDMPEEKVQHLADEDVANQNNLTRKQRKAMPQLKHDISYGQYLHMPKSQRAIFTSQATKHRNKIIVRLVVIAVLIVVLYLLITYLF